MLTLNLFMEENKISAIVESSFLQENTDFYDFKILFLSTQISNSGFDFDTRSETETTVVSGNEWMTETVTSIAYKKELSDAVRYELLIV